MKSILLVVLIALAISSSFAVKIKGSCPNQSKPSVDHWYFDNVSLIQSKFQISLKLFYFTISIARLGQLSVEMNKLIQPLFIIPLR